MPITWIGRRDELSLGIADRWQTLAFLDEQNFLSVRSSLADGLTLTEKVLGCINSERRHRGKPPNQSSLRSRWYEELSVKRKL
ncbi:MAG TPA: hypothetical protein V6C91_03355 [Coleofasciculaceae cyanobacterium]